jgi:hypothetical protein
MIQIGHYYRSETPQGIRTIKCMQMDASGNPYGIYSPSDFQYGGDGTGMIIPQDSPEATELQAQAWEAWYNSNV